MKTAAALFLLLAAPALGASPEDVSRMAKARVSDEVILAQIQADGSSFELSTDQILALKEAGVSDRVLKAMIETRSPSKVQAPPEEAAAPESGMGRLHLANDTSDPYCAMVSPDARTVFLYYGRLQDRLVLEPGGSRTLEVPPGVYTVRWVGERARFTSPVPAGGTTRVVLTRMETEDFAGLHVTILSGEHEADAGMLKVFREFPKPEPAAAPAVSVPAPYAFYGAYPPPAPLRQASRRRTPFLGPMTLLGAGVGAVIGHQSDSRDKGAALGAVLGHFLDHARDD